MQIVMSKKETEWWLILTLTSADGDKIALAKKDRMRSLVLNREDFIRILYETLGWWPSIARKRSHDILIRFMDRVNFSEDNLTNAEWQKLSLSTIFSRDCVHITGGRSFVVGLPYKYFFGMAVHYFASAPNPRIELDHFDPDFRTRFLLKWRAVREPLLLRTA